MKVVCINTRVDNIGDYSHLLILHKVYDIILQDYNHQDYYYIIDKEFRKGRECYHHLKDKFVTLEEFRNIQIDRII